MSDLLQNLGLAAMLFIVAAASGYVMVRLRNRPESHLPAIDGCTVRIKCDGTLYRTRLTGFQGRDIVVAAPLSRDSYVPIRIGQAATLELLSRKGVLLVQTRLSRRNSATHELVFEGGNPTSVVERRATDRLEFAPPSRIWLNEFTGELLDFSEKGAKAVAKGRFFKGERIAVILPWHSDTLYAWIVAVENNGNSESHLIRFIFEEPANLPMRGSSIGGVATLR